MRRFAERRSAAARSRSSTRNSECRRRSRTPSGGSTPPARARRPSAASTRRSRQPTIERRWRWLTASRRCKACSSSTPSTSRISTAGVRPETDFFLWKITERYEDLGELGAALNATPLAGWLATPYSYLATTKASEYTKARKPRQVVPKGSSYLVVYPFVKLRSWYS